MSLFSIPRIDFSKSKSLSFAASIVLSIASLVLIWTKGLNFNIEFTGGTNIEIATTKYDVSQVRDTLHKHGINGSVQSFNQKNISIKAGSAQGNDNLSEKIKNALDQDLGDDIEYLQIESVGPQMGEELISSGTTASLLAFVGIMAYIWLRFEWQFSIGIILSLIHDTIISLGFMSLTQLEFNISTIAGILTIVGYSVNDSVVIYDRIRENIKIIRTKPLSWIINTSIYQTLSRTTLTVLTTVMANAALVLFGGEAIFSFSILVMFGFLFGTYSSIFIAAPILLLFIKDDQYLNTNSNTTTSPVTA